jgi:hypothetical protein
LIRFTIFRLSFNDLELGINNWMVNIPVDDPISIRF